MKTKVVVFMLLLLMIWSGSVWAVWEFNTVGVYDPTDAPHYNDVDQNATYSSATGSASPENVVDLETFQAIIGSAFQSDGGGVIDFELANTIGDTPNDDSIIEGNYGVSKTKSLAITVADSNLRMRDTVSDGRTPISGSRLVSADGEDYDLTIGPITGGAPDEKVVLFGIAVVERDGRDILWM